MIERIKTVIIIIDLKILLIITPIIVMNREDLPSPWDKLHHNNFNLHKDNHHRDNHHNNFNLKVKHSPLSR
jgi:hypothetical protein